MSSTFAMVRHLLLAATFAVILPAMSPVAHAQRREAPFPFPGGLKPGKFDPKKFDPSTFSDPSRFGEFFEDFFGAEGAPDDAELDEIEVSWQEESKIGARELEGFKQRLAAKKVKLKDRGAEATYLNKLLAVLQPKMQQAKRYDQLHVHFYDLEEPQAYTAPGGHVFLSSGMLKTARCEAALVCVLGHELSHLDRGHLLRRAKQLKLFEQRMKSSGEMSPERMFKSLGAMQQLFQRPFGPNEELDADRDGITWAYELGYDPQTINDLYAAVDKAAFPGAEFMPAFFRTHPPSAERRENLAETIAELKRADPKPLLYVGRENLMRRIPRSERKFPE